VSLGEEEDVHACSPEYRAFFGVDLSSLLTMCLVVCARGRTRRASLIFLVDFLLVPCCRSSHVRESVPTSHRRAVHSVSVLLQATVIGYGFISAFKTNFSQFRYRNLFNTDLIGIYRITSLCEPVKLYELVKSLQIKLVCKKMKT